MLTWASLEAPVGNLDDVKALCAVQQEGIVGAITGRAIYEGSLDFTQAQKLADELSGAPAANT